MDPDTNGLTTTDARKHRRIAVDQLMTELAERHGTGSSPRAKMKYTRRIITKVRELGKKIPVDDFCTKKLLPTLFPRRQ